MRTFGRKRTKKGDFAYLCAKILSSLRNRKKGGFFCAYLWEKSAYLWEKALSKNPDK